MVGPLSRFPYQQEKYLPLSALKLGSLELAQSAPLNWQYRSDPVCRRYSALLALYTNEARAQRERFPFEYPALFQMREVLFRLMLAFFLLGRLFRFFRRMRFVAKRF